MKKHTHHKVFYYKCFDDICVYTARPKRRHAWSKLVIDIARYRELHRKRVARESALIDSLKADTYKTRSREDHDRLVERQVERIQEMHRLRVFPYSIFKEDPCGTYY